jgi:hypothetical protein
LFRTTVSSSSWEGSFAGLWLSWSWLGCDVDATDDEVSEDRALVDGEKLGREAMTDSRERFHGFQDVQY